ncbi:nitroreductase/quinone reductase family protein [Rhodococcus wratislaviensis]|uniref:Nitroreductase n=1 Tax=Rhodococcus wratislaviensis NBRC 100605 TaxID=1219028 RepID=X0PXH2_RHOWR|nr:hypothetical protein RW1_005_01300 [Rhodococcus wratislaviensis NBRC 100605]
MVSKYSASPLESVRDHVARYESSDGADGYERRGFQCIILTHIGRRSGLLRKSPLMKVVLEGQYILVASFAGQEHNPLWVDNVLTNSFVQIQDQDEIISTSARLTNGCERESAWRAAVAAYPPYAEYQRRTSREFPLFTCQPRPGEHRGR